MFWGSDSTGLRIGSATVFKLVYSRPVSLNYYFGNRIANLFRLQLSLHFLKSSTIGVLGI